ncbi:MAG: hypothetical protein FWB91_14710 [Defluviitaleaceae bacterium]|nr:hypothetical protein [Defluviitaleaceae bacterium]
MTPKQIRKTCISMAKTEFTKSVAIFSFVYGVLWGAFFSALDIASYDADPMARIIAFLLFLAISFALLVLLRAYYIYRTGQWFEDVPPVKETP